MVDSAKTVCACVWMEVRRGAVMTGKSAAAADFVPLLFSLSLFLSLSLSYKPPTLFTLITQIGFPGDKETRQEKGVTGGP